MGVSRQPIMFINVDFPEPDGPIIAINPARPTSGIFVAKQVARLRESCRQVVVAPIRVFPHLRLWRPAPPERWAADWRAWRAELDRIPRQAIDGGVPVHYPRYTSPPTMAQNPPSRQKSKTGSWCDPFSSPRKGRLPSYTLHPRFAPTSVAGSITFISSTHA